MRDFLFTAEKWFLGVNHPFAPREPAPGFVYFDRRAGTVGANVSR
jgi:hypothetical protein